MNHTITECLSGDHAALNIHVHQMVIICEFGKQFSLSFVITPPHPTQQTDRTPAKRLVTLERLKEEIKLVAGSTFYTEKLDTNKVSFLNFCF